jgi:hypothetical protein
MRGSPPLHLLIVLLGFALFAIPLAKLTFARPESPNVSSRHEEPIVEQGKTKCRITVRSVPKLASFSLKTAGGGPIAGFPASLTSPMETDAQLALPDSGAELLVSATWPPGTAESALSVEIEPDGRDALAQARWSSSGQMNEVLTFKWLP